jgi:LysM repeat protein
MSEQNTDTPIADNNSVTNDSTKADTNDNSIPKARLDEVVAQKHRFQDEANSYKSQLDELKAKQESARKKELEKQGEYKTLLDEANAKIEKLSGIAEEYTTYKTNKRASLMENITNDDDKLIAEDLSLAKLEKFVSRVTQTNTIGTPNQRPANSSKGTGDFGGYSSYQEWATKDPEGYKEANNTIKGQGINIAYE